MKAWPTRDRPSLASARNCCSTIGGHASSVHPEWVEEGCFAAGIPGRVRFIYLPKRGNYNWTGTIVKGLEPDVVYSAFYFDPATGRRFEQSVVSAPSGAYASPRLPSPQDWVLVLETREGE